MKAVLNTGYGQLDSVLTVGECPVPELDPASAMILVKVHAASINPVDYKVMEGHMKAFMGVLTHFPRVPGCDVCGVVEKAGAACKWAKVGDRIFADWPGNLAGKGNGTLAQFTLMPESFAAIAPKNLSDEQCAAIPLAGLTAYQAIKHKGEMEKGMKVLVLGGSGGVGTFALQCAKYLGASHIATTSSSVELCKKLGADQVVNYKEGEDLGEILKGGDYDVVFDAVGGLDNWTKSKNVMTPGARYVTIAGPMVAPEDHAGFKWQMFLTDTGTEQAGEDLAALRKMCETRKMKPVLDPSSPYTLDAAPEAFKLLQSSRAKGKLVFTVKEKPKEPTVDPAAEGAMEMKVSMKKSAHFYVRAATSFLTGLAAKPAEGEKEAVDAKDAVDHLRISGLGQSINAAISAATAVETAGLGTITRIQTAYPLLEGESGSSTCAQIVIDVKRK